MNCKQFTDQMTPCSVKRKVTFKLKLSTLPQNLCQMMRIPLTNCLRNKKDQFADPVTLPSCHFDSGSGNHASHFDCLPNSFILREHVNLCLIILVCFSINRFGRYIGLTPAVNFFDSCDLMILNRDVRLSQNRYRTHFLLLGPGKWKRPAHTCT